jgi:predicted Zn-ribbon and HTH transcriptional regulator
MEQSRRGQIIDMLKQDPLTLKGLAKLLEVPLKVVEDDLRHIEKSVAPAFKLRQMPPECEQCGFVFRHRTRYTRPSRCPKCKSEHISDGTMQLVAD